MQLVGNPRDAVPDLTDGTRKSVDWTMQLRKILVVEDFEAFRRLIGSVLQERAEFQVIHASDGLEALQKAEKSQPDLILLDVGLPMLNGMEVAKRVGRLAPCAKLLFVSQETSSDVVREAFRVGAQGYVHKLHTQRDLMPAIDTVFVGKKFVSRGLEPGDSTGAQAPHSHEILFCSDESVLLDGLTRFIAGALNTGNAAIVWATEPHRASLLERLCTQSVDIDAAIQRGIYIASDVTEPADLVRMLEVLRCLSEQATKAGREHPRVAVCGERAGRLWAEGKTDEAIRLEQLLNELAERQDIDILCPYPTPQGQEENPAFKSICAEHTAVHSR